MERVPFESPESTPSLGARITEKLKSGLEKLNPKKSAKKIGAAALGLLGLRAGQDGSGEGMFVSRFESQGSQEKDTNSEKKKKKKSKIARALSLLLGRSDEDHKEEQKWPTKKQEVEEEDVSSDAIEYRDQAETNDESQEEFETDVKQDRKVGFVASYLAARRESDDQSTTIKQLNKEKVEMSTKVDVLETAPSTVEPQAAFEVPARTQGVDGAQTVEAESMQATEEVTKLAGVESADKEISNSGQAARIVEHTTDHNAETLPVKKQEIEPSEIDILKVEPSDGSSSRAEKLRAAVTDLKDNERTETIIPTGSIAAEHRHERQIETTTPKSRETTTFPEKMERKSEKDEKQSEDKKEELKTEESDFEKQAKELEGEQLMHNPEFLRKRLGEESHSRDGIHVDRIEQIRNQGAHGKHISQPSSSFMKQLLANPIRTIIDRPVLATGALIVLVAALVAIVILAANLQ